MDAYIDWGGRPETAAAVAARLAATVATLPVPAGVADGQWLDLRGHSALPADLERWVEGRRPTDDAGGVYDGEGYACTLVRGLEERGAPRATLSVTAGADVQGTRSSANVVTVDMSDAWWDGLDAERRAATLRALVHAWEPDAAAVYDDRIVGLTRVVGRFVRIGYLTWLSDAIAQRLRAPHGYTAERFAGGTLLVQRGGPTAEVAAAAQAELVTSGRVQQVPLEQRVAR